MGCGRCTAAWFLRYPETMASFSQRRNGKSRAGLPSTGPGWEPVLMQLRGACCPLVREAAPALASASSCPPASDVACMREPVGVAKLLCNGDMRFLRRGWACRYDPT